MNRAHNQPIIGITVGSDELWQPAGPKYLPYAAVPELGGGTPLHIGIGDSARLDECDGLLVSGGADIHPDDYDRMPGDEGLSAEGVIARYAIACEIERDVYEFDLIARALARGMPILGICRGMQSLNVVLGRKLIPDIPQCVPDALVHAGEWNGVGASHEVSIEPDSVVASVYGAGPLTVNSYHHQGFARDMVAPGLRVTAIAPDGVVEAVEGTEWPFVVALQWHPERARDAYIHARSRPLFEAFVSACRSHQ